ncbi:nucleolar pre-ribosomal-associated protein 2 [Diplogelasinospora grovesii]|uniref:Nucleolar pre-ribosomal-associated protein 2 n=1 Tax=Diplogelasinospora grovesii TaxID=303347 RepID=A0AAN6NJ06_9PEZI|nr:nucleolar pre-ribosomal-associated protein 2 [Diplogelasinospora grovesii]
MAAEDDTSGEAALIKTVRALDQGKDETIPEKLERVWKILSQYRGGSFHAAEEMLLRWLLKNMTGTSAAAERLRRYPLAWNILGAVFAWIPLFSLAKSLADRRFISVLQQTLKDISKPQKQATQAGGDTEMQEAPPLDVPTKSLKRKRSDAASFDLDEQRQLKGCLQTAETIFEALRALLFRCAQRSLIGPPSARMGAEHVKSLFSSSAADVMEILVPLLTLCDLAADNARGEPGEEQSFWMATFTEIWNLHLQTAQDASEVAVHLSRLGINLLGKLTGLPQQKPLALEAAVQRQWARDLRRFLTRNMVLPSRAAFLNGGSFDVIQMVVEMSRVSASTNYPVLFDLVVSLPRVHGDEVTKKDYDAWIQAVFDAIVQALKGLDEHQKITVLSKTLEMAAQQEIALSAASLRSICKEHAVHAYRADWSLLVPVIKINPDVFLVSQAGRAVLDQVLLATVKSEMSGEELNRASQFVVLLAEGSAKARDLSGFIKTWFKYLALGEPQARRVPLWSQKEVGAAVARLLQGALNVNQLLDLLDWLMSHNEQAECAARLTILAAISDGISQEEFIDAAVVKIWDGAFAEKPSRTELPNIAACRWTIAQTCLSWGKLEESGRSWSQVKPELSRILKSSPADRADTFAAFKCYYAAWTSSPPHSTHEEEATALICSFVGRLDPEKERRGLLQSDLGDLDDCVPDGAYLSFILSNARLQSLIAAQDSDILSRLILPKIPAQSNATGEYAVAFRQVMENPDTSDRRFIHDAVFNMTSQLDSSEELSDTQSLSSTQAIDALLKLPDALTRLQRERTMSAILKRFGSQSSVKKDEAVPGYWTPLLTLMVKLMQKPTFYPNMNFSDLEAIARRIPIATNNSIVCAEYLEREREVVQLLGELATLTCRQMTSDFGTREKTYLESAVSSLQSGEWKGYYPPARLVLLQAFVSVVQNSPVLKKLEKGGLRLEELKEQHLLRGATPYITKWKWPDRQLLPLLIALNAVDVLDSQTITKAFSANVPSLLETSDRLLEQGRQAGWEIRVFLARHFSKQLEAPLRIRTLGQSTDGAEQKGAFGGVDISSLQHYVDVVVDNADEATRLGYLKELLEDSGEGTQLLIIHRLVQRIQGSRTPVVSETGFDLAEAHSILCARLLGIKSGAAVTSVSHHPSEQQFVLIARTLYLLLGEKAQAMTQWNIERTLGTVSVIASSEMSTASCTTSFPWLCRLVDVVIRRHRKRLDGHFHILVSVLQSLLRCLLVCCSRNKDEEEEEEEVAGKQAKAYARLLTLVCEPSVASVSGGNKNNNALLDSEKDKAKRYAGQHMYLVLMQYIRLQLEDGGRHAVVSHKVREALEPGLWAILDITPQQQQGGLLKIMTDAMDPNGRVLLRELYKQYRVFHKWDGV